MGVNGRRKGSDFERHVAGMVVAAFAPFGIKKADCYRTPLSGGHLYASKKDPGDLQLSEPLKKLFPFSVECKFYRRLDWHKLLSKSKDKGHWSEWWVQANRACERGDDNIQPILVVRQNRSEDFAVVRVAVTLRKKIRPVLLTRLNGDLVRVVRFSQLLESLANVHSK